MPNRRVGRLFVALALVALPAAAYGDKADRVRGSIEILDELTRAGDNAIPTCILERAEGAIVIPAFLKGGFIVGAEHGKGILSVRDRATGTWSPPTFVALTGGSFGAQIGFESVDLVLLVMNRGAVGQLLQDKFTFGASASVAAGPVGCSARAGTDYHLESQILAYSRAKGLFAGATLNGTVLQSDHSAIEAFYGRRLSSREIVLENAVAPRQIPALANQWRSAVARHTGAATTAVPTTGQGR
jgi:lipid-binding SYLF domain-containing protein